MTIQNPEVDRAGPLSYNADCPFCEVEGSLVAVVRMVYEDVPLTSDGYSLGEVEPDEQVVEEVTCSECEADVGIDHYFNHGEESGEECDCKAEGGM